MQPGGPPLSSSSSQQQQPASGQGARQEISIAQALSLQEPDVGEPSLDYAQAVLAKLMEDANTTSVDPGIHELLKKYPDPVEAAKHFLAAEQVVLALRRPELDAHPAGFKLWNDIDSKDQLQQNASIIHWILRPADEPVWQLSQLQHGCWIIQQALEVADRSVGSREPLSDLCPTDADPKALIARGLKTHVFEALQHKYANHVLQKCIEVLPRQSTQFVLDEIVDTPREATEEPLAVTAAKNKYGCRVLQRLIEHFWDSNDTYVAPGLKTIIDQLIMEDVKSQGYGGVHRRLINDQFANFVFRSLLEHDACAERVVQQVLIKDTHDLAKSNYASHVVSYVLKSVHDHKKAIVDALIASEESRNKFGELAGLRMGSFVHKQVVAWCKANGRDVPKLRRQGSAG